MVSGGGGRVVGVLVALVGGENKAVEKTRLWVGAQVSEQPRNLLVLVQWEPRLHDATVCRESSNSNPFTVYWLNWG